MFRNVFDHVLNRPARTTGYPGLDGSPIRAAKSAILLSQHAALPRRRGGDGFCWAYATTTSPSMRAGPVETGTSPSRAIHYQHSLADEVNYVTDAFMADPASTTTFTTARWTRRFPGAPMWGRHAVGVSRSTVPARVRCRRARPARPEEPRQDQGCRIPTSRRLRGSRADMGAHESGTPDPAHGVNPIRTHGIPCRVSPDRR